MTDKAPKLDKLSSIISDGLSFLFPRAALSWRYKRDQYRSYVSGKAVGSRQNFRPNLTSADSDIAKASPLTIARCRDQAQNNPSISGALDKIGTNVVRDGILPRFGFTTKSEGLDEDKNELWANYYQRWTKYCDSAKFFFLRDLQQIVNRALWVDGRIFIHRYYDSNTKGVNPLRVELFEYDLLDKTVHGSLTSGNTAIRGIEYEGESSIPIRYHFKKNVPTLYGLSSQETVVYPAADIIHVWCQKRASQHDGISLLHAIVMEAYRMDEFRVTTQDSAQTQASITGFLYTDNPTFQVGIGGGLGGQPAPNMPAESADAPTHIIDNMIQSLPTGTDIKFKTPTSPGMNYEPFVNDSLRAQASGTGVSFESYANNRSQSSFSASLTSAMDERLCYHDQQVTLDSRLNHKLHRWFIEAAFFSGTSPSPQDFALYLDDPDLYCDDNLLPPDFPAWRSIQEDKDGKAANLWLDMDVITKGGIAAGQGRNWNKVMKERTAELDREIALAKKKKELQNILEGTNETKTTAAE